MAPITTETIRRAQRGEISAIQELCLQCVKSLRGWGSGRLPGWARGMKDTDDLVQDAVVKAVRRLPHFEPNHDHSMEAYVRTAFKNLVKDEIDRAKRRGAHPDHVFPVPAALESPLERAIRQEDRSRYEEALRTLRPADRELIVARMELHLDYDEIARRLNKPSAAAARVAIARAIGRLAQRIRKNRKGRPET